MKILITGARGFICKYVVTELLKYDHEIIATTSRHEIPASSDHLKFVFLDLNNISDKENYFVKLEKPDVLIHLAWQGLPNYKSLFHFEDNLPAHYSFLKNLVSNGLKKIVVTGTCFEYGMKDGCLLEDMVTDPQNPYAIAKDSLRKFLFALQEKKSFDCTWIRLFYMYGKGQNPNSLLSQLDMALLNGDEIFNMSGGEQIRDYLPVEKVAEYIVKISLQNEVSGIVNCCSGKPVKVKDFVENYLKENNKPIKLNTGFYPYPDYEAMAFWGDDTKLKKIISNE
ncbi:MAG: NAD-dependent epimerase/dehydratase family protein [Bacteroidota bacterium]|nr:NAD-dependent epimerase/dehydratase family protein [Bacteroidota bacterium]